ncbi:membrane protein insertion efficiency factor YidD [Balneolaceae bacterium ANBcel3]|nr:membrane protein insertion efficiency factor YidD [Balneolaceae bacterium ANBcel3]
MRFILIALVKGYQFFISPYFPASCRFHPTCSQYAIDAFRYHGVFKGSFLAVWRILRCNPWNAGGEDPVPGAPCCEPESTTHPKSTPADHLHEVSAGVAPSTNDS